jgi:hypothetical protein
MVLVVKNKLTKLKLEPVVNCQLTSNVHFSKNLGSNQSFFSVNFAQMQLGNGIFYRRFFAFWEKHLRIWGKKHFHHISLLPLPW